MNDSFRAALIATAEKQVAAFPQYRGHFTGSVLGRVRRTLKTKSGIAAVAGETVLINPGSCEVSTNVRGATHAYVTFWSSRNGVDTSIRCADMEVL